MNIVIGTNRSTLPLVWLRMAEAAGGVNRLAAELGYGRNAIYHWGHGTRVPHPAVQRTINQWAERHGLEAPFPVCLGIYASEQALRPGQALR